MSDDHDIADAIRQQATGLQQSAAASVASTAQRQQEAVNAAEREAKAWAHRLMTDALKAAATLHQQHPDRTAERVLEDAEKFFNWLNVDMRVVKHEEYEGVRKSLLKAGDQS